MSTPETDNPLWRASEAHWDARTDPFADPALASALAAAPETAAMARRLIRRISLLQAQPRTKARRLVRLCTAAAALFVVAAWLWWPAPEPTPTTSSSAGAVLYASMKRENRRSDAVLMEVIHLGTERHVGWSLGPANPR